MARPHRFGDRTRGVEDDDAARPAWWDDIAASARAHGARPYVVEGFTEISDAVRRGHAVVVRRQAAEVADGISVFDQPVSTAMTGPFAPDHTRPADDATPV